MQVPGATRNGPFYESGDEAFAHHVNSQLSEAEGVVDGAELTGLRQTWLGKRLRNIGTLFADINRAADYGPYNGGLVKYPNLEKNGVLDANKEELYEALVRNKKYQLGSTREYETEEAREARGF